jgi:hypothetical protein
MRFAVPATRWRPAGSCFGRAPRQQPHARGPVGEERRDRLRTHLRDLVDPHGQHVRGQAVAEARERVDERLAVVAVVEQHDPVAPTCKRIGLHQRAQLADEGIGGRQGVGRRARRAGGRAGAATGAH